MQLNVGDKMPQFELYTSDMDTYSSSSFDGNVALVLFYPQAFTSVCTKELSYIKDLPMEIKAHLEVVAISVDSAFTLQKFKEDNGFDFTLLSDFNKEVSRAFGALYEKWIMEMKGVSKRAAFVIDKSGTIRYAEVLEDAGDEPNYPEIIKMIKKLNA